MAKKKGKGVGGPSKAELLGPASVVGFFDPPRTSAEHLIWLARRLLYPPSRLIMITGKEIGGPEVARAKLAIDFWNRGPAFMFQANFEEWTTEEIIRRVY
jgi:hypothetical protein